MKFILHLKVPIKVIFDPEPKIEQLKQHLLNIDRFNFFAETFDKEGRPIYNEDILFIFEGELNTKKKRYCKNEIHRFFSR